MMHKYDEYDMFICNILTVIELVCYYTLPCTSKYQCYNTAIDHHYHYYQYYCFDYAHYTYTLSCLALSLVL